MVDAASVEMSLLLFAAGSAPKFVKAPVALVAPVPPFAIAIVVPLQTPAVIVPTLVKLELVTLLAKVFPVNVFASASILMLADPSNGTPLIFFVAANFVAVAALPVVFWLSVGKFVNAIALPLGAR